ncbi:Putative thiazole biosynthetic enzyme [Candidatus Methanoperedenaceae archaeon GB50]|nr:Putative thiazole biosynthetic enzyme [Candidatus Methanoperedenaceae archaeon GB50]
MSEVIIIGGGPAGLNCAYYLAKSGKDVILLEKHAFPVDKLCAGGLTVKDFEELPKDIIERAFVTQIIHYSFR